MSEHRVIVEGDPGELEALARIARSLDPDGPLIVRVSRSRAEILVPLAALKGGEPGDNRVRLAGLPGRAGIASFIGLLLEERFYEAHMVAEEIMRHVDRHRGRCYALYSALLVKASEGLPRAVEHLLGEMSGCDDVVSLECVRSIAARWLRGERPGGEAVACLRPL